MGRRGPAPLPAGVKAARGETRPSRVNYDEPLPAQRAPIMPRGMEPLAKTVWKRVLRDMESSRVILAADTDTLRAYAEAVVSYNRYRKMLVDSGPLVRGARGQELVVNPLSRLVREERDAIRLLSRELGLSPAARANIHMDTGSAGGDMEDILPPLPKLKVVAE